MLDRLSKLKNILRKKGVPSLLITNPVNVYYLSGFKSDTSSLLITEDDNFIITDFRYRQDAQGIDGFKPKLINGTFKNTLKELLKALEIKCLGFEAGALSWSNANRLKTFLVKNNISVEPLNGLIEELRIYKDEGEVAIIKMAVVIANKVVNGLKNKLRPGITEKGLVVILENLIRTCGGDTNSFETIIASGENSSRPHARITDKPIVEDEHVLIDFGVRLGCYNCDLTRIFFLGKIHRQLKDIYAICKEAHARAIRAVRPGVRAKDIDKAARSYIASKGFNKYFGHGLGHGVGLAVHELPIISPKNNQRIKPNMVFTVEPGIYIDGIGGVRIEDMVRVTEKGCEVLTDDIPK